MGISSNIFDYWQASQLQLQHFTLEVIPKTDDFLGRWQTSESPGVHTTCMTGVSESSQQPQKITCEGYPSYKVLASINPEGLELVATCALPVEEQVVIIIPKVAKHKDGSSKWLLACYALFTPEQQLKPYHRQPLPWLLAHIVEPSSNTCFALADRDKCEQTYQLFPPPWMYAKPQDEDEVDADELMLLTFAQQLSYAQEYFANAVADNWEQTLQQAGYTITDEMLVISLPCQPKTEVASDFIHNPPKLLQRLLDFDIYAPEDPAASIQAQDIIDNSYLHKAHVPISTKANRQTESWCNEVPDYSLSEAQRGILTQALLLKPNSSMYIDALVGTGKTAVLADLVATLWVNAALSRHKPPQVVKIFQADALTPETAFTVMQKAITIFDYAVVAERWLPEHLFASVQERKAEAIDELLPIHFTGKVELIAEVLINCSDMFGVEVENLEHAKRLLHEHMLELDLSLQQGLDTVFGEAKLAKQYELKYASSGGIKQRAEDLQQQLAAHEERHKHLQVLKSLWERQVAAIPKALLALDVILPGKNWRLAHLYGFFKQHLPQENVVGMNIKEMTDVIADLLTGSNKKQHILQDAYLQVDSDIRQLEIISNAAKAWRTNNIPKHEQYKSDITKTEADAAECNNFLDCNVRQKIFTAAVHYWEVDLLISDGAWQQSIQPVESTKLNCDYLVVENLEDMPAYLATSIFTVPRLIAFGDKNMARERAAVYFSHAIDMQLLSTYKVMATDEELEDLEYLGLTTSKGNLALTLSQIADHREEPYCLQQQYDVLPAVSDVYLELMHNSSSITSSSTKNGRPSNGDEISLIDCNAEKVGVVGAEYYLGSRKNSVESNAIIAWLKENWTAADKVTIYTQFYGQMQVLRLALQHNDLGAVAVELLDLPGIERSNTVIFSPVYGVTERGNFAFDSGMHKLANLFKLAKQRVIIFGDARIFDPKLHSPTGKIAKILKTAKCEQRTKPATMSQLEMGEEYTPSILSCDAASGAGEQRSIHTVCEQRTKPATMSQLERLGVYEE